MVEYETEEDANNAITKLRKRIPSSPVAMITDVLKAAEGSPAEETINAMANIPARTQGLECKIDSEPRRFDLNKLMVIYDPSASFMNAGGMWGYPVRKEVKNEGTVTGAPEQFNNNE